MLIMDLLFLHGVNTVHFSRCAIHLGLFFGDEFFPTITCAGTNEEYREQKTKRTQMNTSFLGISVFELGAYTDRADR